MAKTVSTQFRTLMEADVRFPRQALWLLFPEAGTVKLSDQILKAPYDDYQPLVVEWGKLIDMAGGDPQKDDAGEIRQMSVTLWNGGTNPISNLFLAEQPENVIAQVWQGFDDVSGYNWTLIDRFVVQDPIDYDESSRLLKLDLVSLSMRYDRPIGAILTQADFPNIHPDEVGKELPLIIGTPGEVPTYKVKYPPTAILEGSILTDTTTVTVKESLDDLGFPATGQLQIDEEIANYTSRTEFAFNISFRGTAGTVATEHITGAKVKMRLSNTFAVCKGPIQSISTVRIAGQIADPADYTVDVTVNLPIINFTTVPKVTTYAAGATFLEMQFDDTNAENTAFQAWAAYEGEENLAARLTETESLLSIKQVTVNPDRGEIVKAFLAIEHWEDGSFLNDYAEVSIEGIGVVGRLSRPSIEKTVTINAEVDIDHGHDHSISGEHVHDFTDPALQTVDPTHTHASGLTEDTLYYPQQPTNQTYYLSYDTWTTLDYFTFEVSSNPWSSGVYSITVTIPYAILEVTLYMGHVNTYFPLTYSIPTANNTIWKGQITNSGTINIGLGVSPPADTFVIAKIRGAGGAYGATAFVGDMTLNVTRGADITPAATGNYVDVIQSGANDVATDKSVDDVQALTTGNVQIIDVNSDTASSTIVNLFDITAEVNFDWSWFTDRDITIEYIGTEDQRKIYIRHAFFDIEYRKKEVIFSDDVTCEPVGLIDDASGTITGTPNKLITAPNEVRAYLLRTIGGLSSAWIDTTSFSTAGSRYSDLDYQFDGVLDGGMTVREAEKKLAFQCRSRWFWNDGKAKIAVREKPANQTALKFLTPDDLQLRSIKAQRQRVTDISNVIDLQYNKKWTDTGEKPFTKITSGSNLESIALNSRYEHRDKWTFDMVANDTMAADLLDYYLDTQSTPSTFYTFNVYLKHFDLEKGDVIGVSSAFGKLIRALMEVKSVDRIFGSGRNKSINRLRVTAESIRYALISIGLEDAVTVLETLNISFKDSLELADIVFTQEGIILTLSGTLEDSVTISEVVELVTDFVSILSETATVTTTEAHSIGLSLTEDQVVFDIVYPQIVVGYGGGGFGTVRFGGLTLITNILSEALVIAETIAAAQTTTFSDELTTINEALVMSSGFGTPVGDGFGGALYGS